jgi:hypothetical protein
MLNLEGNKLSGPATLFSDKDNQRLRDCTVSVDVNASPSSFPQVASTPPLVSSLKEAGKVVLQAQEKMTGQAVNGIKTTTAAAVGAVGAVTGIAQSGVETPPPANSNAGKLFNSKAELLQKTRSGQYLNLYRFTSDETVEFASSVLTVLASEYGVKNWPTERAMVNGAAISRIDSACKGEFEANVRNLFGETARAYANTLDDRPPAFGTPRRTTQSEREQFEAQLRSQQGGWCSGKTGLHPYLTAIPKLLAEFDGATAFAVDEKRNQLRTAYQQMQAQEAATAQANEQAKQAQMAKRAESDRQAKEKELSARQQREAYEKGAAVRNAQKIKAIGLPSDFLASTLYVNYMGQWSAFMPCAQWVALLLENKKIASVEAISMKGYPGVSIKRIGQPAMGLLFRMEGKEAYAYAIVANGRAEPIQSPADHSQIALLLKVLTSEKDLN